MRTNPKYNNTFKPHVFVTGKSFSVMENFITFSSEYLLRHNTANSWPRVLDSQKRHISLILQISEPAGTGVSYQFLAVLT